jgi:hypothetical protein
MSARDPFRRRSRKLRVVAENDGGDPLLALQSELTLLREENARLKAEKYRRPDLGTVLEQARVIGEPSGGDGDAADEAAQLLADGLMLRETLLKVCREMNQSMLALEARLLTEERDEIRAGSHA